MKILLDTHILLWVLTNDSKLTKKARDVICDSHNDIRYSIISPWEVEIKHLAHPGDFLLSAADLIQYCEQSGFTEVAIKDAHIMALSQLKRDDNIKSHKDPFDRILICQTLVDNMMLVTHDTLIAGYNLPCVMLV